MAKPENWLEAGQWAAKGRLGLGQGFGGWRSGEKVLPKPRLRPQNGSGEDGALSSEHVACAGPVGHPWGCVRGPRR